MLQIDHIYEFFNQVFKNLEIHYFHQGIIEESHYHIFNGSVSNPKILFYDQEPLVPTLIDFWVKIVKTHDITRGLTAPIVLEKLKAGETIEFANQPTIIVTSEKSDLLDQISSQFEVKDLYYFYHGFAALDWYRGHYALNSNKTVVRPYKYSFISMNRIINNDRSYRIYFVSKLKELELLDHGRVSFNVTDNIFDDWQGEVSNPNSKLSKQAKQHAETHLVNINKLVIDKPSLPGSASADIPRGNDAFWNIVSETVFYYPKLHLTEKIFKPIVSKQPFMLLAAPGNLAYLRSYGFKTFDGIIDESYDNISDNDTRIEAVVKQLAWYCGLSDKEKTDIMRAVEPVVLHNFHHFYGEFKQIITQELLTNTKTLFQDLGHDDSNINYNSIYHVLTH